MDGEFATAPFDFPPHLLRRLQTPSAYPIRFKIMLNKIDIYVNFYYIIDNTHMVFPSPSTPTRLPSF